MSKNNGFVLPYVKTSILQKVGKSLINMNMEQVQGYTNNLISTDTDEYNESMDEYNESMDEYNESTDAYNEYMEGNYPTENNESLGNYFQWKRPMTFATNEKPNRLAIKDNLHRPDSITTISQLNNSSPRYLGTRKRKGDVDNAPLMNGSEQPLKIIALDDENMNKLTRNKLKTKAELTEEDADIILKAEDEIIQFNKNITNSYESLRYALQYDRMMEAASLEPAVAFGDITLPESLLEAYDKYTRGNVMINQLVVKTINISDLTKMFLVLTSQRPICLPMLEVICVSCTDQESIEYVTEIAKLLIVTKLGLLLKNDCGIKRRCDLPMDIQFCLSGTTPPGSLDDSTMDITRMVVKKMVELWKSKTFSERKRLFQLIGHPSMVKIAKVSDYLEMRLDLDEYLLDSKYNIDDKMKGLAPRLVQIHFGAPKTVLTLPIKELYETSRTQRRKPHPEYSPLARYVDKKITFSQRKIEGLQDEENNNIIEPIILGKQSSKMLKNLFEGLSFVGRGDRLLNEVLMFV